MKNRHWGSNDLKNDAEVACVRRPQLHATSIKESGPMILGLSAPLGAGLVANKSSGRVVSEVMAKINVPDCHQFVAFQH
jgi:hypothetical protein